MTEQDRQVRLLRSLAAFQAHQGLKTIKLTVDKAGNYMVQGSPSKAEEESLCSRQVVPENDPGISTSSLG
jgi:hypothetical protein